MFNSFTCNIETQEVYLTSISDKTELMLLENRYPQCLLGVNNTLQINLILSTLGR